MNTATVPSFDLAPPLQQTGAEVHDVAGLRSRFTGFESANDLQP
jgi:hypothetical protein